MLDKKCVFCPARQPVDDTCTRNSKFYFEAKPNPVSCYENIKDCTVKYDPDVGWTNKDIARELEIIREREGEDAS